jgi:drug/metabolite transporter (DMT)-like permease
MTCTCARAGLFDNALGDYLWSRAVLLVGPTIATVGTSLQVPIAMVVDPLVHTKGWWSTLPVCTLELLGASAILGGFFTINAESAAS